MLQMVYFETSVVVDVVVYGGVSVNFPPCSSLSSSFSSFRNQNPASPNTGHQFLPQNLNFIVFSQIRIRNRYDSSSFQGHSFALLPFSFVAQLNFRFVFLRISRHAKQ
ncbi:hypothetical protein AAHE18_18G193800 [Arachis hypogaea]